MGDWVCVWGVVGPGGEQKKKKRKRKGKQGDDPDGEPPDDEVSDSTGTSQPRIGCTARERVQL